MEFWPMYGLACLGVVLSVVLPSLTVAVRREWATASAEGKRAAREAGRRLSNAESKLSLNIDPTPALAALFVLAQALGRGLAAAWPYAKPYVLLGLFSMATSFLVLVAVGDNVHRWQEAFLAGYAWDSTAQKFFKTS
jgi:hypothetical protein